MRIREPFIHCFRNSAPTAIPLICCLATTDTSEETMGRRSGFGGLINAVARDLARAQRASVSAQKRAVREQESRRRQYERALRQQQRAQAAHTREMEREAKRQYLEDQMEAAADQTAAFSATVDELEAVLTRTLTADDRIDFES